MTRRPTIWSAAVTMLAALGGMLTLMVLPTWATGFPGDVSAASEQSRIVWERGFGPFLILVAAVELGVIIWLIRDARQASARNHARRDAQTDVILSMAKEQTAAMVNANSLSAQILTAMQSMNTRLERIEGKVG